MGADSGLYNWLLFSNNWILYYHSQLAYMLWSQNIESKTNEQQLSGRNNQLKLLLQQQVY